MTATRLALVASLGSQTVLRRETDGRSEAAPRKLAHLISTVRGLRSAEMGRLDRPGRRLRRDHPERVTQFEDLLPFIRSRVVEVGVSPLAGPIARFDKDLYFRVIRIPGQVHWTKPAGLTLAFCRARDRSARVAPLDA